MTDHKNLILAIVVSVLIILAFQFFYEIPRMQEAREHLEATRATEEQMEMLPAPLVDPVTGTPATIAPARQIAEGQRLPIHGLRLHGSVGLTGSRIDDLTLADYRVTPEPGAPEIRLLGPAGSDHAYFAEFGWVRGEGSAWMEVPGRDTEWESVDHSLSPESPMVMRWRNEHGVVFTQTIEIDRNYMFTITREVANNTDSPITLHPYGLISRWETPDTMGYFILHEGPIGVLDGRLREIKYSGLQSDGTIEEESQGGWLGFTDKYWLAALIPDQQRPMQARFSHTLAGQQDRYQADFTGEAVTVQPHSTERVVDRMFAGAKEVRLLDEYRARYDIPLFDRAVDFGWFYFLTKPIFHVLNFFHMLFGNYGVAILCLTLIVKLLFYPLADKSYRSMSQMKKLQPEMVKLQEKYAEDRQKLNQEMMALYKREGVNPVSGCLPIIVQIPVFFALYKVLFVSIEMRHAPFFGWIRDLSAPDPVTPVNLFGLLPFDPPGLLAVGIWPILMGITMYMQQRLNPQPPDPMQAKVMMALPFVFVFLFATFPAGLVIYWTWNNILSVAQQWLIMKRMGVQV